MEAEISFLSRKTERCPLIFVSSFPREKNCCCMGTISIRGGYEKTSDAFALGPVAASLVNLQKGLYNIAVGKFFNK